MLLHAKKKSLICTFKRLHFAPSEVKIYLKTLQKRNISISMLFFWHFLSGNAFTQTKGFANFTEKEGGGVNPKSQPFFPWKKLGIFQRGGVPHPFGSIPNFLKPILNQISYKCPLFGRIDNFIYLPKLKKGEKLPIFDFLESKK